MPSPVKPSVWKALINSLTGSMCERMSKLFQTVTLKSQELSYRYNEAGLPSDEYKADLCEALADCLGDGGGEEPPNPNMAAPEGLSASDDAYSDKIVIDWEPVTGATQYRLYRSLTTSFSGATLIATITAPTIEYEDPVDDDLEAGVKNYYWARATDGTNTSALSNRDQGRAASEDELGELAAISDLRATQGHSITDGTPISLVFTPPDGAMRFDVYRNTVNDFATATKVVDGIEPDDATGRLSSTNTPDQCWDNGEECLIYYFPPSPTVHYYFWVVSHGDSPPSISEESNSVQGWVRSNHSPYTGGNFELYRGETAEEGVDFTGTKIRVVLVGPPGGGAGGSQVYGGGGGGGGAVVVEEFVLSAGDEIGLVMSPDVDDTGNAAALADGDEFVKVEFQINGVTKMTALAGHAGQFNPAGGGAGGLGDTGSGTTTPTIYDGKPGLPGSGASGGASGYYFGSRRFPAAHFNGFGGGDWSGDGPSYGNPGGGSAAAPGVEVLAVGGAGKASYAIIAFGV